MKVASDVETLRIFSRPALIFWLVLACLVAGLIPAFTQFRGASIACRRESALKCEARRPTLFGAEVTSLPAHSGGLQLLKHDEEDKSGWYLEASPGGSWSRSVSEREGHLALQAFTRFIETNGAAAFEAKLSGSSWFFFALLASIVGLVVIAGPRTVSGQRVVLDVERNLLRVEERYLLRRSIDRTRTLTSITHASKELLEESNEGDVILNENKGSPLLRAMSYDCDRVVEAIHSAVARARELHGHREK